MTDSEGDSIFLSREDLIIRTGRKQKSAQCRVLVEQGIPFALDADGRPVVLKSDVCRATAPPPRSQGVDIELMEKLGLTGSHPNSRRNREKSGRQ